MVWFHWCRVPQVCHDLCAYRSHSRLTRYNRKIPTFLADHVEKNNLQGKLRYELFVGASSGAETEDRWASLDMISRRAPHQVGKAIAKGINTGKINFFDKHLSMFPVDLVYVRFIITRLQLRVPTMNSVIGMPNTPIGILHERSAKQQTRRRGCRGQRN